MAKEDKYIAWGIALPVVAFLAILLDVPKHLPQAVTFVLFLALLLPTPVLIYLAKKEAFKPVPKAEASSKTKAKAKASAIVEVTHNKKLRNLAMVLRLAGVPLLFVGWQIARNTTRVWYYVLAGVILLTGTILVGVSVGFMKAANE